MISKRFWEVASSALPCSAILPTTPASVLSQLCHLRFRVTQSVNGPELRPSGCLCAEPSTKLKPLLSGLTICLLHTRRVRLCCARKGGVGVQTHDSYSAHSSLPCARCFAQRWGSPKPAVSDQGRTGQDASGRARPGSTRLGAGGRRPHDTAVSHLFAVSSRPCCVHPWTLALGVPAWDPARVPAERHLVGTT